MSNSLSTFIMRGSGVVSEERGQETPPNAPSYPPFLPQSTPAAPAFLTGTPDTFLTLPEQMEGEGEGMLGSSDGEGVSQGSLLYLDSASALHVLVHHLPQPQHQPTPPQLVEEEGSQEQFVVVGALKNEEELAPPSPPATCHVSVESILEEELVGGRGGEIYLPQPQDTTPTYQHFPPTPVLTLVGGGSGTEAGDTNTTGITLDTVPHITLEEIIQKFASSPDSPVDALDEPSTTTTTITAITPQQEQPPPPPPPLTPPPPPPSAPSTPQRVKVKVVHEPRKEGRSEVSEEEVEGDEGCLYDVVVTYRCRVCGEVYESKSSLIQHHQQQHKQGGVIKIKVTTSNTPTSTSTTQVPHDPPPGPEKEQREINIHSCGFCSKDFLSLSECQEHISKEHPTKRMREGGPRHYQTHGTQERYPTQPGMLIGHRKARTPGQGEAVDVGGDEAGVEGKRKVKVPRTLQDQFWLHKQRPKPVCLVEVEKTHRCLVPTCKYKFSSEANLRTHQECHGGGKADERGFACPHCALRCDKWSVCQLHLWKDHGLDIDLLTCGICHTYKTCTQQRLLLHQKIHSDARDHVCKTCGKGFKQLAQLLNHQVLHITNPKDIPAWAEKSFCEECQRWFKDKKALKMHRNMVHLKMKPFSCPECSYRCSRKFDLKVHMRQHTGERPHRCPLCGWQASDHNTMRRHKLGHQDLKPYHCPIPLCNFDTRHPACFKQHMTRRHPKNEVPYKCQFCPLETGSLHDYVSHSMKHEKILAEEAMKRGAQDIAHTPEETNRAATGEGSMPLVPTTTSTTTTTALTTTTDTTKQPLPNPIDFNHKVEYITIKFDDPSAPPCPTREDGKPGEGGDGVVVEEGEGEAVSLPQVVVSENNCHYILRLPTEFTPTMSESDGACNLSSNTHPEHHKMKHHHHTVTTNHHAPSHPHPHSTSPQDCNTTT